MAKTLGQVAREKWGLELVNNNASPSQSWQAVADAVIAAHESRRWQDKGWKELQFEPTRWDGAGASIGKWENGRWMVVHGITFASTAHEMGFTHFCIPELPAPPQEVEHGT